MQSSLKAASLLGIAVLAALGLAGARPAAAQIVKDGSFETPASSPFETFGAGSTLSNPGETSPWTVGSGSVDVIDGYWMSYAGNQSIDLSGDSNGSIYQDLTTTIGTTYNVSYYLAGNPDDTQTIKTLGSLWASLRSNKQHSIRMDIAKRIWAGRRKVSPSRRRTRPHD